MNGQVCIGREFFAKVKNDYADWRWALVREFLQNCFDAPGSKAASVTVASDGRTTTLNVSNDGAPMDRDTLVTKLLTLGGSGKNFDGDNAGGFGVAKSLLYYCHLSYAIATGDLQVSGEGAQYRITDGPHYPGTSSVVTIDGDHREPLERMVRKFAALAQWKGELKLNSETLETSFRKGARRRDLGWAVVYTNQQHSNTCVVRINGQPMFTRHTRFRGCVVVELTGKANDTLTSNRDALRSELESELGDLLTQLAVDKRSALREQRAEYKRYAGQLQKIEAERPKECGQGLADIVDLAAIARQVEADVKERGRQLVESGAVQSAKPTAGAGIKLVAVDRQESAVSVGPQFILKNTTGRKVPVHYVPGERFSKYAKRLVGVWTAVLLKLHRVLGKSCEFSVGFGFDSESEAECERSSAYGLVYYVNPVKVLDKTMKARFSDVWEDRHAIISLALHELVHGTYDLKEHDEDYACVLTDCTTVVMRHLAELECCCRETPPTALSAPSMTTKPVLLGRGNAYAQEGR